MSCSFLQMACGSDTTALLARVARVGRSARAVAPRYFCLREAAILAVNSQPRQRVETRLCTGSTASLPFGCRSSSWILDTARWRISSRSSRLYTSTGEGKACRCCQAIGLRMTRRSHIMHMHAAGRPRGCATLRPDARSSAIFTKDFCRCV